MRRLEYDGWSAPSFESLLPPRHAEAPFIAGPQSRKAELRHGSAQVISVFLGELEELFAHHRADGVQAMVARSCTTVAIPKETREGIAAATLQFSAEDVCGHWKMITAPPPLSSRAEAEGAREGYL